MGAAREQDAAGITGPALRASYARCRALSAEHAMPHLTTLLLPVGSRPFVDALYGFVRHVDHLPADDLDTWGADFLADLDWGATSDPVGRAVIDTAERWSIPHGYFAEFLDARRADLTVRTYATFDDLRAHLWGSTAVVGLQLLPILGRRDDDVRWDVLEAHTIDLGLALRLTIVLRDVARDLRDGRIYLPQATLAMFGVDEDRLRRGVVDESIRNLLAWEIERTRGLYAAAAPGLELLHPSSRGAVSAAFTLHAEILSEIERADYDVFTRRVRVGPVRRAAVGVTSARAALTSRRGGRPPVPATPTA